MILSCCILYCTFQRKSFVCLLTLVNSVPRVIGTYFTFCLPQASQEQGEQTQNVNEVNTQRFPSPLMGQTLRVPGRVGKDWKLEFLSHNHMLIQER